MFYWPADSAYHNLSPISHRVHQLQFNMQNMAVVFCISTCQPIQLAHGVSSLLQLATVCRATGSLRTCLPDHGLSVPVCRATGSLRTCLPGHGLSVPVWRPPAACPVPSTDPPSARPCPSDLQPATARRRSGWVTSARRHRICRPEGVPGPPTVHLYPFISVPGRPVSRCHQSAAAGTDTTAAASSSAARAAGGSGCNLGGLTRRQRRPDAPARCRRSLLISSRAVIVRIHAGLVRHR